ncbi:MULTISPECIES: FKBP-type peptidyl-prolyl cis-trans isomerase [unclassified Spirosoma]|uniref:FKBP-type peptidyl-prolyl cis-trans isomerase n=1 Tax=unclassified Spirosoma TaxID=2621999 RepID=UPI0009623EE3|nr:MULTISPECIES: FKBP-type peptidyl-prolyl cis-trans isomerase [unclassified Spirosoma]MBN8823488.1 FKBP-type peptidyl-prolyl cis-trans isomerase [Spirosoma sp.]OJW71902.1 MAG: FKBP-type peptidylprolyl isomerase [Spirosoma sp. 48-14]
MFRTLFTTAGIGLISLCLLANCQSSNQPPCEPTPVTITAPDQEIAQLKQFIESKQIKATADKRGFYYTIQNAGSGAKPTVCSNVSVNYEGHLTDGTRFDSGDDVRFGLNQLIVGWQEGIPLIAPGGRITLYLPPSLAYGDQQQGDIPAHSILVFQIDLLAIH